MKRKPDPAGYVTVIDPALKSSKGPLQVLSSKATAKPERKPS